MLGSFSSQMFHLQPTFFWVSNLSYYSQNISYFSDLPQKPLHQEQAILYNQRERQIKIPFKQQKRRAWTIEEDEKLLKIIQTLNFSDSQRIHYYKIAQEFQGRSSKQIRQRYLNHLNSSINKEPFKKSEDELILKYYAKSGPQWKKLSLLLKGRTPTSIKNRFNTKLKHSPILNLSALEIMCKQIPQCQQMVQSTTSNCENKYIIQSSI